MTVLEHEDIDVSAEPWDVWLSLILPSYCGYPMAPHHEAFWDWLWSIEPGVRPDPFVAIWPRGGAKSTSAEGACVALGARHKRRYGLYVCDTQDRADDHVGNVASMLESERVELFYPALSSKRVGKHGNSRGWRRNRLWTAEGFVIDAIGLDTAARGVKLEDQRPDFLVIDDIDGRHDTAQATQKKIQTLTESVIPAGAEDLAILAVQNLVKAAGVFDQLATGKAEFLRRRILSGPIPAVRGLVVERQDDGRDVVTAGEPTWQGQSLQRVEEQINDWGLPAFRREAQHEVADAEGALWCRDQIQRRVPDDLDAVVVSVDPSGGKGASHDAQGIIAAGRCGDVGFVLADRTCSLSPMGWGKKAVTLAVEVEADRIIVEDNYGGEMTANTIRLAADALAAEGMEDARRFGSGSTLVVQRNAKFSKKVRAEPVAALYGEKERPETWPHARLFHVGVLAELEDEMCTWEPDGGTAGKPQKSPNRVDALAHAAADLGLVRAVGRSLSFRGSV